MSPTAATQFPARKQQADETRARLIDLAWEMVAREGTADFTMRQLAARAGVAVGLPYAYFKTREGLLDELRIRVWDRIDEVILAATGVPPDQATPESFEAFVRAGLKAVVRFALGEPHVYGLIALTPGVTLSEHVLARELQSAQPFINFLIRGEEQGEFEFEGNPTVFALALWTSVQGYVQRMGARMPDIFKPFQENVLDEILDAFFARIRATRRTRTGGTRGRKARATTTGGRTKPPRR